MTPQYAGLQAMYQSMQTKGLEILGFPCDQFGHQEPGTNAEIADFCETRFNIKFPMFEKIVVKGEGQHPLYDYLIKAKPTAEGDKDSGLRKTLAQHGLGPTNDTDILWNFEKFLVGRDGSVVARFAPDIAPDDSRIVQAIEGELAKAA